MKRRHWVKQSGLISVMILMASACTQPDTGTPQKTPNSGQGNAISVPFSVTALPVPGDLSASLDCPGGTTSTPMQVDLTAGTATGTCSNITPGTGLSFTIHFTYGSSNIELAHATKTLDVAAGDSLSLSFATGDYTYPDSDSDGFTNLYETEYGMDPSATNYHLGGSVSGLTGSLVLDNGGDQITVTADGTFTFNVGPLDGTAYNASVATQPSGQTCTVNYGTGTISSANVSNIYVGCAKNGLVFFAGNNGTDGLEPYLSDGTAAGTALLKDVNPNTSSNPSNMAVVNGVTYFTADDGINGRELWKTNGTAAGTTMVKDIYPGKDSTGTYPNSSNPSYLTAVGNTLYFTANDGTNGSELWMSDGTSAGTVMVADIYPGSTTSGTTTYPNSSNPSNLTAVSTTLYFTAYDPTNGYELWKSNSGGTALVKDIYPGTYTSGTTTYPYSSYPGNLTAFGTTLYFTANDGTNGTELWKSTDGTAANTTLVSDIYAGASSSGPYYLTVVGGTTLYFSANDGTNGYELWKSNGTAAGTVMAMDIYPGTNGTYPNSSSPSNLTTVGSTLFFTAYVGGATGSGTELWKSNSSGTSLVADIYPGSVTSGTYTYPNNSYPSYLTAIGATLYFAANDGTNGTELWKSDGTAAGTTMVGDIYPGTYTSGTSSYPYSSYPSNLTAVNSTLYFTANDGTNGTELWKADGSGATLVDNINPGVGSSNPSSLINNAGVLYFSAYDGVNGQELWRSGSTDGITSMVADISSVGGNSYPSTMVTINGVHYFTADNGSGLGSELWRSDGTTTGTYIIKQINSQGSSSVGYLTAVGSTLYFRANDGNNGTELWKTDGTDAGTVMVKDIYSGANGSNPYYLTAVGSELYFVANDGTTGAELWKSDGTDAGTVQVKDIVFGANSSSPSYLTAVGSTLFFRVYDTTTGTELWKSDGTDAGTVLVKDIYPGTYTSGTTTYPNSSNPSYLTAVGSTLYFQAYEGGATGSGTELWKSDGTAAGTVLVKDIYPGTYVSGTTTYPNNGNPYYLTAVGNTLYFQANDGTNGSELWMSDGTDAGTVMVKDIYPGTYTSGTTTYPNSSGPYYLTAVGSTLFFRANDTNGSELWKSDGTAAGTVMVKDIYPGTYTSGTSTYPYSSYPSWLTDVNGTLYFLANDGTSGQELWKSDGTPLGTTLVKDLYSGAASGASSILGH